MTFCELCGRILSQSLAGEPEVTICRRCVRVERRPHSFFDDRKPRRKYEDRDEGGKRTRIRGRPPVPTECMG